MSGWALDVFGGSIITAAMAHHENHAGFSWIKFLSAVSLLGMIVWSYLHPKLPQSVSQTIMADTQTITLAVEGMTCSHCANHVKQALESIPGIHSAKADATQNLAWIEGEDVNLSLAKEAIEEAGYQFKGVSEL